MAKFPPLLVCDRKWQPELWSRLRVLTYSEAFPALPLVLRSDGRGKIEESTVNEALEIVRLALAKAMQNPKEEVVRAREIMLLQSLDFGLQLKDYEKAVKKV